MKFTAYLRGFFQNFYELIPTKKTTFLTCGFFPQAAFPLSSRDFSAAQTSPARTG
jgi:hypothetical protein